MPRTKWIHWRMHLSVRRPIVIPPGIAHFTPSFRNTLADWRLTPWTISLAASTPNRQTGDVRYLEPSDITIATTTLSVQWLLALTRLQKVREMITFNAIYCTRGCIWWNFFQSLPIQSKAGMEKLSWQRRQRQWKRSQQRESRVIIWSININYTRAN